MRLIDADALKEDIERLKQNLEKWVAHTECDTTKALVRISLHEEFIDLIDNAETIIPFASVETQTMIEYERPQGEWKSEGYFVFCDYCGSSNGNNKTPFCPYCGAEMKEGEDHAID